MSLFVHNKNSGTAEVVVSSGKKRRSELPKDIEPICYCYFCQQQGVLHRCRDEAYNNKRYVVLPNGRIQFVCNNHIYDIPANRKVDQLPEVLSIASIAAKASP